MIKLDRKQTWWYLTLLSALGSVKPRPRFSHTHNFSLRLHFFHKMRDEDSVLSGSTVLPFQRDTEKSQSLMVWVMFASSHLPEHGMLNHWDIKVMEKISKRKKTETVSMTVCFRLQTSQTFKYVGFVLFCFQLHCKAFANSTPYSQVQK